MECSLSIKEQKHEVRGTFGRELVGCMEEGGEEEEDRGAEDKRVCERRFISPGIYGRFFSDGLRILAMDHRRVQSAGLRFQSPGLPVAK